MRKSLFIVYGLFFVSLSILGTLSIIFYQRYSTYTQYADAVEETYEVITELNRLATFLKDAETGQRGFLLTRDSAFLEPYISGIDNAKITFLKIRQLTAANLSQQQRLTELNLLIEDKIQSMEHTRFMFLFNSKVFMENFRRSKEKMDKCRDVLAQMEQEERQLLSMRQESKEIYQSSTPEYLKALFAFSTFTFLISFVLIIREFRSRVRSQNELEQKVRELNQSNAELEQITFVTSHDLQEPLRKINTFSDRLESKHLDQLNDEGRRIVERISYASNRMRDLIEDLVNYTNLIKRDEIKSRVDLNHIIEVAIHNHLEEINQKNAKIAYDQLPTINGYRNQLLLLFDALVSNSLKFTSEGVPPHISIVSSYLSPDNLHLPQLKNDINRFVKIVVKDNGIGFDNEFAEKVFGIFQRLHNQHSEYTGKGVGLAIVKRVMANHNGFVFASGKPLDGAEFTLLFPNEV
jgi:signal transduction histidine kinase